MAHNYVGWFFDQPDRLKFYPKPFLVALPFLIAERVNEQIDAEQEDWDKLRNLKKK
jgi:hypothetical protein